MTSKQKERKTILFFGETGGGKSTCCNVTSGSDDFPEGPYGTPQTQTSQIRDYVIAGENYRLIDTPGIFDPSKSPQQTMKELADTLKEVQSGFNRILFVLPGRCTKDKIEGLMLITDFLLDKKVLAFVTIVRSRFSLFRDQEACCKDIKELESLHDVFKICKIIHINNMPKEEDPTLKAREESRTRLLVHLRGCKDVYIPKELDGIEKKVLAFKTKEQQLEEELAEQKKKQKALEEETARQREKDRQIALALKVEEDHLKKLKEAAERPTTDIYCPGCNRLLSFTKPHDIGCLTVGAVPSVTCGWCNMGFPVSPAQLAKFGIYVH